MLPGVATKDACRERGIAMRHQHTVCAHFSWTCHCFAYCVFFSSFLSLMLSLKEPYRETSMGVKLNIAYQM